MAAWKEQCVVTSDRHGNVGGQQVGMTRYTVKVVHAPTGITALCGYERSQLRCRNVCFDMIEYGLVSMGWSTE